MTIIKDQKRFFDLHAKKDYAKLDKNNIIYINLFKNTINAFSWMKEGKNILDYGCGVGKTIELYKESTQNNNVMLTGVDISGESIKVAKQKYPYFNFFKIRNNKIPQVNNNSIDGAYLSSVLHHTHNHQDIFSEIYKKLKMDGKFFIQDMSSNNFIVSFGRKLFNIMPKFIKNKFVSDLVIDGDIPDKYRVDVAATIKSLENCGFKIKRIDYSGLFIYIFEWTGKIFNLSKFTFFKKILKLSVQIDSILLKYPFFQKRSEVFYIRCVKNEK